MDVAVTSALIGALLAEARAAHPLECCGLLLGTSEAITAYRPAANVDPMPHRHFEIDPQTLIDAHRSARQGGPGLVGYYHSHPSGPPEPSAIDRAMAARDGMIWAILGEERVTLWRAGDDGLTPLPIHVTGA